jgi:CBS domain-containing protein
MFANQVRDILVPLDEYPKVGTTSTLLDAFKVLRAGYQTGRRYRHVLVLDAGDRLVGILSMRDILRGIFPDYLRPEDHQRYQGMSGDVGGLAAIWQATCEEQCPASAAKPVSGFMAAVPSSVTPDSPIALAAYLLVAYDTSMLPVVENQRVVGVCRIIDVFNEASEAVLHD